MLTLDIEKLPSALRHELAANPKNFRNNEDVFVALQFFGSPALQREFRGELADYLAFFRGRARQA